MIQLDKITSQQDVRLDSLFKLYEDAFPEIERRDIGVLRTLIMNQQDMNFYVIRYADSDAGLLITWDLGGFHYIEHFAIYPELRNKRIGEQLLECYKSMVHLPILFEVEPGDEEMALRRIGFYERNGFQIVEKEYRQLPYRKGGKSFQLWIMSSLSYQNLSLLREHLYTIKERVYARFW